MAKCKETDGWINVDVIPPRGLRILGDALEAFVERMAVAANQRRVMKDKEGLALVTGERKLAEELLGEVHAKLRAPAK